MSSKQSSAGRTERPSRGRPALSGLLGAALALGVAEVAGALLSRAPSPVAAVARALADLAPLPAVETGISAFGTNDKPVLLVVLVAVSLAIGAWLGTKALVRWRSGVIGFVAFGLVGVAAGWRDPTASPAQVVLAVGAGVAVGLLALRALLSASPEEDDEQRRRFLLTAVSVGVMAAMSGAFVRFFSRSGSAAARSTVVLPPPVATAPVPAGASLAVEGLTPFLTPNDKFYRIDTAFTLPEVDLNTWRLRVKGMVERPFELSFADLLAMPLVEEQVTIACVSNEVGEHLIGNASWRGVLLRDLLGRAGVRPGADQIVGRSTDGYTCGFPTELALDGRSAMVVVGMNGQPLPLEHGFPARLIVPGLYGYVSATKWLQEIELASFEAFDQYWVRRGWAARGPIKTQSRIDVPSGGRALLPGRVPVAGVAWAPTRGITKVEVKVDDQPWAEARLAEAPRSTTWRQWLYEWDAAPGRHTIQARATDGTGETQTADVRPPFPDGATGYHTIRVDVG